MLLYICLFLTLRIMYRELRSILSSLHALLPCTNICYKLQICYLNFYLPLLTMKLRAVIFFTLQRTELVEDSTKSCKYRILFARVTTFL